MKFVNGRAEFSKFEQRRFGIAPAVTSEGEDSFVHYSAAKAAITRQIENNVARERAGEAPLDEASHVQHAAQAIGFLGVMADERDAYIAEMTREYDPNSFADLEGYTFRFP